MCDIIFMAFAWEGFIRETWDDDVIGGVSTGGLVLLTFGFDGDAVGFVFSGSFLFWSLFDVLLLFVVDS